MTVDRSYSPYEAIRMYQDRGMMKWGAYSTPELKESYERQVEKVLNNKKKEQMTLEEIMTFLTQSFVNQVQIKVKYKVQDNLIESYGFVSEFIGNKIRLKSTSNYQLIDIESVISITGL